MSLITSRHGSPLGTEVCYTLSIYSSFPVCLDDVPRQLLYTKTVTGALTSKNSGGNSTHPTFMNNPQYALVIHANPNSSKPLPSSSSRLKRVGTEKIRLSLTGSKDVALNVKMIWASEGGRVTDIIQGDIVLDTGPYNYGVTFASKHIPSGQYTIVISGFNPGAGMFAKTVKGAWRESGAAGPPSSGAYPSNPAFLLTVPASTQMQFRLQLIEPRTRVPINVTIFKAEFDQAGLPVPGAQVVTSGGYHDDASGVVTSRQLFQKGNYLIYASTHRAGVEEDFKVIAYSSATAVTLRRVQSQDH